MCQLGRQDPASELLNLPVGCQELPGVERLNGRRLDQPAPVGALAHGGGDIGRQERFSLPQFPAAPEGAVDGNEALGTAPWATARLSWSESRNWWALITVV